ncbi:MAG: ethanolamine utilization protein EutM [Desulforhopalus sp.]|jgi:ethanolamine utilization protein EutM
MAEAKPSQKRATVAKNDPVVTQNAPDMVLRGAVGIIETVGFIPAIEAADAMLKSAHVTLAGMKKVGSGLISIVVRGDVGAVQAATEAGAQAAKAVGRVRSVLVIPRPHDDVEIVIPTMDGHGLPKV